MNNGIISHGLTRKTLEICVNLWLMDPDPEKISRYYLGYRLGKHGKVMSEGVRMNIHHELNVHTSGKRNIYIYIIPFLIGVPVFLEIGRGGLRLGEATVVSKPGVVTYPISIMVIALFTLFWVLKSLLNGHFAAKRSTISIPVLIFLYFSFISFLGGVVYGGKFNIFNLFFFLQMIGPIFSFWCGLTLVDDSEQAKKTMTILFFTIGASAALLLIQSFIEKSVLGTMGSILVGHIWIFNIYQLLNYFPLVVAVACGMGFSILVNDSLNTRSARWLALLLMTGMSITILLLRGRGPLLTLGVIIASQFFFGTRVTKLRRMAFTFPILLLVLLMGLIFRPLAITRLEPQYMMIDRSARVRTINWSRSAAIILRQPLFGLGFVPQYSGRGGVIQRVANPHNQYLAVVSKAGLPAMIAFISIIIIALRHSYILYRNTEDKNTEVVAIGVFSILLGVALVSNFVRDSFTQPYSAVILWFLIGVSEALYCNAISTRSIQMN